MTTITVLSVCNFKKKPNPNPVSSAFCPRLQSYFLGPSSLRLTGHLDPVGTLMKPRTVTGLGHRMSGPNTGGKWTLCFICGDFSQGGNKHQPPFTRLKCTGCGIVMYLTWVTHNHKLKTSYFNIQGFGFAISKYIFFLSFFLSLTQRVFIAC